MKNLKVALIHDFLVQEGGAERVLDVFHNLWPNAPIYTLVYNPAVIKNRYHNTLIKSSLIQKLPFGISHYKWYLALMPRAIESFDLSSFDLVISDSSAFAKGVIVPKNIPHICYLHTPTRYLWSDQESYLKTAAIPWLIRPLVNFLIPKLQKWDLEASKRPDIYIANSKTVADRLKRYYQRNAETVIFPPVNTSLFNLSKNIEDYWFTVSRFEPYKRLDLILSVFAKLGLHIKIAGTGSKKSEFIKWEKYPNIEFVGKVSDTKLAELYSHAKAIIFAPEEDAGIVPLEAMAAGRPILAYGAGGAKETIIPGVTGEFFENQTEECLIKAIKKFDTNKYNPQKIRQHALVFDIPQFASKIISVVENVVRVRSKE